MTKNTIGVGIIGARGWAKYGHILALRTLPEFELVAISSRKQETADQLAAELDVPNAFGDYSDLIAHPDVDMVVIPTLGPEHAHLVRAAIARWEGHPQRMAADHDHRRVRGTAASCRGVGVRHVVGFQRRFAPSASYTRDLIAQGYVDNIRGVQMSVGVDAFAPAVHHTLPAPSPDPQAFRRISGDQLRR